MIGFSISASGSAVPNYTMELDSISNGGKYLYSYLRG